MRTSIRFARKSLFNAGSFFRTARGVATAILLTVPALGGCHQAKYEVVPGGQVTLQLTSSSFRDGRIPKVYTCDGADTSPQLAWSAPPAATKSLALMVIDPDTPMGAFVHWVLYNLPPTTQALPEGVPKQPQLPDGSRQGQNDFPKTGYGGPCPPGSSAHHYVFVLYAVDTKLNLPPEATGKEVEAALKGHVLAHGELVARFSH